MLADATISAVRVAREPAALIGVQGKPACIVADKGTEFIGKDVLK